MLISSFPMQVSGIFWHFFSSHVHVKLNHTKLYLKLSLKKKKKQKFFEESLFIHETIITEQVLDTRHCSRHWKHTSDSGVQCPCWGHCLCKKIFLLSLLFPWYLQVRPCLLRFLDPYLDIQTFFLPFLLFKYHKQSLICPWLSI